MIGNLTTYCYEKQLAGYGYDKIAYEIILKFSVYIVLIYYKKLREKNMLNALLSIYIGWLLGLVLTTVFLIVCGYGWGPLPHLYVRLVKFVQSFYPHSYPRADDTLWPAIIKRCDMSLLRKHHDDSLSSFHFR